MSSSQGDGAVTRDLEHEVREIVGLIVSAARSECLNFPTVRDAKLDAAAARLAGLFTTDERTHS